jgi:hypothetical protein
MKYIIILCLFLSGSVTAQTSTFFDLADDFFQTYVDNGRVRYAEIKQNPKALKNLLNKAKNIKISSENEAEYKAFWINAYNIAVINGIVKAYPVKSPMDIKGFFNEQKHSLGQRSVTLDEIEKKILLGTFPEEERFHFVLVCAAKSCPPIIAEAYRPQNLEKQLQQQTVKAMNDPQFVKVKKDKVLFSEVMKWYNKDFTNNKTSLIDYANKFRKNKISNSLTSGFYTYNWELNDI